MTLPICCSELIVRLLLNRWSVCGVDLRNRHSLAEGLSRWLSEQARHVRAIIPAFCCQKPWKYQL